MPIKLNGQTSGSVQLNVPAAVSGGDVSLTLPNGTGAANQFLKNGSAAGTLEYSSLIEDGSGNITTTGTATFAGNVTGLSLRTSALGGQVTSNYNFVSESTDPNLGLFIGCSNSGAATAANSNASIRGNGSATFAGVVAVNRTSSGDGCFHAQLNGTTKASIASNGEGLFDQRVSSGRAAISGSTVHYGITAYNNSGSTRNTSAVYARNYNSGGRTFTGDNQSGTTTFEVFANGNIVASGSVSASNVSDIRFKENITDANPQLADAVALGSQLKNWDWKDDAPLNEELRAKRFLGLVAQEAEKVCPELTYTVPRTKQGAELTPETTDEEGNVTPATYEELDDSYKAINHDILVMKLLGAVAEQNTQIETLKTKVAALEAAS